MMASNQNKSDHSACGLDATMQYEDDDQKPNRYVLMDSRQGLVYSPGVWKNLIVDFTLSFLITNPKDLVSFGLEYFNNLRTKKYMMTEEQEEHDNIETESNLNPVLAPTSFSDVKKDIKPGKHMKLTCSFVKAFRRW